MTGYGWVLQPVGGALLCLAACSKSPSAWPGDDYCSWVVGAQEQVTWCTHCTDRGSLVLISQSRARVGTVAILWRHRRCAAASHSLHTICTLLCVLQLCLPVRITHAPSLFAACCWLLQVAVGYEEPTSLLLLSGQSGGIPVVCGVNSHIVSSSCWLPAVCFGLCAGCLSFIPRMCLYVSTVTISLDTCRFTLTDHPGTKARVLSSLWAGHVKRVCICEVLQGVASQVNLHLPQCSSIRMVAGLL